MDVMQSYRRLCCSECGIVYFFSEDWCGRASSEGKSWKCPNGHGQCFGDSDADKLRRERDRLAQRIAQKDDEIQRQREMRENTERQLSAQRGLVTRIKNRVGRGVCPCCNRSFENLHHHMKTQHPDFAASEAPAQAAE